MIIDILDRYTAAKLVIKTNTDSRDANVSPKYSGDEILSTQVKEYLSRSYGAYGHIIDHANTTNLDLYKAIAGLDKERYDVTHSVTYNISNLKDERKS